MVREFVYSPSDAQNRASFYTKIVTVTTAGTAVQGATQSVPAGFKVVVKALSSNTGTGEIGTTEAIAEGADAFPLEAGEGVALAVQNINQIWFDSTADGDEFAIIVET